MGRRELRDLIRGEHTGNTRIAACWTTDVAYSTLARPAWQVVAEEALTRRDVRAAREMKKFGWANWRWCSRGLRDAGPLGREQGEARDPFDDCDGVALDAVPAPEPVLGTASSPLRDERARKTIPPPLPLLTLDSHVRPTRASGRGQSISLIAG